METTGRRGVSGASSRTIGDRYRLEALIGRGGAGSVWRGYDERLDRAVAVKEIVWPSEDPDRGPERAVREARAAARLQDPGVVQVFDMVTGEDRAYLVMELVEAPSLQALVARDGPLEPHRAAALGLRILRTLGAAHTAGIVHRDVKPSNVLVDGDVPRLTDFGIARLAGDANLTTTGTVLGTPSYIAPEQARGEPAGPAADLYGLGATLYYAVEGAAPFAGDTPLATAMAVLNAPPRPLQRGGDLEGIITALLGKDPAERPDTATVERELERATAGTAADPGAAASTVGPPAAGPVAASTPPRDGFGLPGPSAGAGDAVPPGPVRTRRGSPGILAAVALLLGVAVVTALLVTGALDPPWERQNPGSAASAPDAGTEPDPGDADTATPQSPASEDSPAAEPSPEGDAPDAEDPTGPGADEEQEPTGPPADGVLPGPAEVPGDWVTFSAPDAPYQVRHPPGWEVVPQSATITDLRDPQTGIYLRLDWVDEARDPVGSWEELSADLGGRREGYEQLQLVPTTFQGNDAALWEYRYGSGGSARRAYNLGVTTGQQGYGINLHAPEGQWDTAQDLWPAFLSSYEFAGG